VGKKYVGQYWEPYDVESYNILPVFNGLKEYIKFYYRMFPEVFELDVSVRVTLQTLLHAMSGGGPDALSLDIIIEEAEREMNPEGTFHLPAEEKEEEGEELYSERRQLTEEEVEELWRNGEFDE
jgi:hypothetical protein